MIAQTVENRSRPAEAMGGQPERFLRLPSVIEMTSLSCSTIYEYMSNGKFPKPVRLGGNKVAWLSSEVGQWMQERINERKTR